MEDVFGDRFVLTRKLATGGMAEVYVARQKGIGGFEKQVVIKRILPHLAGEPEFVEMFLDEARTAANLRHKNVVKVFEVGQDGGTYFIVMEYLQGQNLRALERACGQSPLPLDIVLRIGADAARGLHHAHELTDMSGRPLQIVHRDVTQHNVIVTWDGVTKIVDFGIARAIGRTHQTATGMVRGKASYMSPEQAVGGTLDGRSDQFSLAVVLYELSTRARLFHRSNDQATLKAVFECQVRPPSEVVPGFPKKLEAILLRALSREAGGRYPDSGTLADALDAFALESGLSCSEARLADWMKEYVESETVGDVVEPEPATLTSPTVGPTQAAVTATVVTSAREDPPSSVPPPVAPPLPPPPAFLPPRALPSKSAGKAPPVPVARSTAPSLVLMAVAVLAVGLIELAVMVIHRWKR